MNSRLFRINFQDVKKIAIRICLAAVIAAVASIDQNLRDIIHNPILLAGEYGVIDLIMTFLTDEKNKFAGRIQF